MFSLSSILQVIIPTCKINKVNNKITQKIVNSHHNVPTNIYIDRSI